MRKEIYATTGTRMRVRLFAGWDFKPGDELVPDFAGLGYTRGVPMGGRLNAPPKGAAPTFIVRAMRDPDWANLDRIQIIKGWLDADGKAKERIYDIAVSGGRKIGADGRARTPVGTTVDIAKASYTNTIGAPLLAAHWRDPDFDPNERAFYYVRVLEIPTPRWTTYDAARFGVKLPTEVPRDGAGPRLYVGRLVFAEQVAAPFAPQLALIGLRSAWPLQSLPTFAATGQRRRQRALGSTPVCTAYRSAAVTRAITRSANVV